MSEMTSGGFGAGRVTVVKWANPVEELVGVAKLAHAAERSGAFDASEILLCVPSVNWGEQLRRACRGVGIDASFLVPRTMLGASAQGALARLSLIVRPDEASMESCSMDHDSICDLMRRTASLKGFSLVRSLGIDSCIEFAHALRHVQGDEDACALLDVITEQLSRPTLPQGSKVMPIVHYRWAERKASVVFLVGCVEGLVPPSHSREGASRRCAQEAEEAREAFRLAIGRAEDHVVVSYFACVGECLARAAGIAYARTRVIDGESVAMARPTRFLEEWKSAKPSTEGGQALLGRYGLR